MKGRVGRAEEEEEGRGGEEGGGMTKTRRERWRRDLRGRAREAARQRRGVREGCVREEKPCARGRPQGYDKREDRRERQSERGGRGGR